MNTRQDAVRLGGWTRTLEELDHEVGRLAMVCKVPILEPGVIDRVLHGDRLGLRSGQPDRVREAARAADDALRDPQEVGRGARRASRS